jgi:hypothetical protein
MERLSAHDRQVKHTNEPTRGNGSDKQLLRELLLSVVIILLGLSVMSCTMLVNDEVSRDKTDESAPGNPIITLGEAPGVPVAAESEDEPADPESDATSPDPPSPVTADQESEFPAIAVVVGGLMLAFAIIIALQRFVMWLMTVLASLMRALIRLASVVFITVVLAVIAGALGVAA